VDRPEDVRKLWTQLISLVQQGRTFPHKNRPLYRSEVQRFCKLGLRCLTQIYGDGSPEYQAFEQLSDVAFSFLPMRRGHIRKVELIDGAEAVVAYPSNENRVYHLNKLDWNNGLEILIKAARQLKVERCQPALRPPRKVIQDQEVQSGGGQPRLADTIASDVATERQALCTAFKRKGKNQGIKITDKMIAMAAYPTWNTRTMVTWWKRNDPRCKALHDKRIRAVLAKEPNSLWR
jgi:hypothetical protein